MQNKIMDSGENYAERKQKRPRKPRTWLTNQLYSLRKKAKNSSNKTAKMKFNFIIF